MPEVALTLVTLSVYWPVAGFGFLHYDDYTFVIENAVVRGGLTIEGLRAALTAAPLGNLVPLSLLSHMVDVQLFGLRPAGHHLVNLLFHLLNVLFLYRLVTMLTGERLRSLAAAAIFAVHPLQVEVVAWVAQRRTVLMMFFGLLALHAYVRYARRSSAGRYLAHLALYLCGLLAKAPLVVLPLLLLLLDYWPLGRFGPPPRCRRLVPLLLEKTPLLLLAAANGVITFLAQRGALNLQLDAEVTFAVKGPHALVAWGWYLVKTLWPADLAVFYPYPMQGDPLWASLGAGAALAGLTAAALAAGRHRPYLPVGWLWFLIALVPVSGLVQAGLQAYADRYLYLPLFGGSLLAVWAAADLLPLRSRRRAPGPAVGVAVLLALSCASAAQVRHWRDEGTLFNHALAATGGSHVAHTQLGCLDLIYGRPDEAVAHFQAAIRFSPRSVMAHKNLALAYSLQGRKREAQAEYDLIRRLYP